MTSKIFTLPLLFVGLPLFAETTYDFTFNGASGTDYNWNTTGNWAEKALPTSNSTVLIECANLFGNNLVLENDITVKSIYWNVVKDTKTGQVGFNGSKNVNAESFEVYQSFSGFKQFFNGVNLNITNSSGTGLLTVGSTGGGQWSFYFRASKILADNITVKSGAIIEQSAVSTQATPRVVVNNLMTINSGAYYITTANSGDAYQTFGGLSGAGRIMSDGGTTANNGYITLTNKNNATFSGLITLTNAWTANGDVKKAHIIMDKTATAVQYLSNASNIVSSVTANGGEISMLASSAGALTVAGGKLSVFNNEGALTNGVINASTMAWNSGTVGATIGLTDSSKIVLSGALTKGEVAEKLILSLDFDTDAIALALETSESITRDIITYDSTNFSAEDSALSISGPSGFNYDFNFGKNALSVTITLPEPATFAVIFGAIAVLAAFIVRRRK